MQQGWVNNPRFVVSAKEKAQLMVVLSQADARRVGGSRNDLSHEFSFPLLIVGSINTRTPLV
jgi:hypothetical protein